VISRTTQGNRSLLLSLTEAKAIFRDRVLFAPEWGTFDMALGSQVVSVFGGPADRVAYGETTDFVAKRVPAPKYSDKELLRHSDYGIVRKLRENKIAGDELQKALEKVLETHNASFPEDWLLSLEALELLKSRATTSNLVPKLEEKLANLAKKDKNTEAVIRDGLILAGQL
jgi:phenylalanine-4-hydroxylase